MALNVISNFAADVAHRNLSVNDRAASTSLAKLSSGSRVVSAKDDAASLAIGSRLNAEVQGLKQAQVNAIQATSMLQIADGAMSKVSDILVRMKTLAVQAGSGQLSGTERSFLDTEYQSLLSEIDRIAQVTEFNGTALVNGSSTTSLNLNGQSAANNLIQSADGFAAIELGSSVGDAALSLSFDATNNVLTLTNLTNGTSQGINIGGTAIANNDTQTVNFTQMDVVVTLNSAFDKTTDVEAVSTFNLGAGGTGSILASSITISSASGATSISDLTTLAATLDTDDAAVSVLTLDGFTGSANLTTVGAKSITMSDGTDSFTVEFTVTEAFVNHTNDSTVGLNDLGTLLVGSSNTSNSTSFTFKLGTGAVSGVDDVTVSVNAVSVASLGLTGGDITTASNADSASTAISAAIDTLNTARASVGAAQNRLDFASDNLATTIENSEAARSNLMDLDVAAEMTNFTAKQVLVQVGVSMLAQANQMPQNLLRLFQ